MSRRIAMAVVVALAATLPAGAAAEVHFTSPSGNIDCWGFDAARDGVTCIVQEADWTVPERGDCDFDWVPHELFLRPPRRVTVGTCRSDVSTAYCYDQSPCTVLGYGRSVLIKKRIRCTSRTNGITCRLKKGRGAGFRVARESYRIFR